MTNSTSPLLLLTGTPGIGKTTLIKHIAAQLGGHFIAGFYTQEIRLKGHRAGFELIGFSRESGVIAHVDFDSPDRVGRYGVDVATIDRLAESNFILDGELYLIDEIGKMECLSPVFVRRVERILNSGKPVISTVAKKGGGFIEKIKQRPGREMWEATHDNRDKLVERALTWLRQQKITS
ncbi:nucleoside-triphosphatase [Methylohalobius crimeensis]|uniref:nucleoside-triphosphatase n=1 Tax=Methylohalobius crimeensis TaxID=244365 RepID=UPI0003B650EE|nr:nucleoside-triphosphatase [Methylohalobius crimeensis]